LLEFEIVNNSLNKYESDMLICHDLNENMFLFFQISSSDVFQEVTYELPVTDTVIAEFLQGTELYKAEKYHSH